MTKIEKQMTGVVAVFLISIVFLVTVISKQIEDAGGCKGIAIEAGKEIKDISREIDEH